MKLTKSQLRRIIKEELDAIMGRKPSGAPMTAQARQDILDGYVAFVQDKMPNVSREEALKSAVDLFVAGGDPYLDPQSDLFDQDLLDSLMGEEGAMNEAAPKSTHRGKVKNKDGRVGMVSSTRKDKLGLMMTVVYRDGETPKQETVYASDLEVV